MFHPCRVLSFAAFAAMVSFNLRAVAPTDFKMKLPIAVNAEAVGEKSATDLPVLVRLSESIEGFKYSDLASDGSDLAFGVNVGGVLTVYPHEIDTWDPEGESLVWVKVPTVDKDTAFAMYYGYGTTAPESKTAVWSGYQAVWHMNEADGVALDATGSGLDAVPTKHKEFSGDVGAINVGASGKIGGARQNGSKNGSKGAWYAVPEYHLTAASKFSISGWVKMTAVDADCYPRIFSSKRKYDDKYGFEIELAKGSTTSLSARGASKNAASATVPSLLDWVHLCFVYDDTTVDVYANGALVKENGAVAAPNETYTLSIGANNDGSEFSFYGLFDEVRLFDGVQDAARVALEYEVMSGECIRIGEAEPIDETMPRFSSLSVVRNASNDGFDVFAALVGGSGKMTAVFTDVVSGEVLLERAFEAGAVISDPGGHEVSIGADELVANRVYACEVKGSSTGGNPFSRRVGVFYNGTVSVTANGDADEDTLAPGGFVVSATQPLPVDFAIAYGCGGTAVEDQTYEKLSGGVVLAADGTAGEIIVKPIYTSKVTEDVTVSVDLTAGTNFLLGESPTAEVKIVDAVIDPDARYVSPSGSSGGSGLRDAPFATIDQALATLTEAGGTIWLNTGTYSLSSTMQLSTPVTIRSVSGNPADVTINKASGNITLVKLDHAEAKIMDITVSGGGGNGVNGGNVYIDANGGIVEHCIIENGDVTAKYGTAGGNVYMKAGIVTRCVVRGGKSNYNGGGGGVWMSGGQVESCLIEGNSAGYENSATYSGDNGGGVRLTGADAKLVNCTLVRNRGNKSPAVQIDYDSKAKAPKGTVINCVIVDNLTMNGTWDFYNVGGAKESVAAFVNCLTDARIAQPNESCFAGPIGFADRFGDDYRPLGACGAVDAGAAVTLYSDLDLDGNPRTSGAAIDAGCYEFQQTSASVGAAVSDDEVLVGEEVTFSAAVFGGAAGEVSWNFGEGEAGATGAEVTHAFVAEGWKDVTATVGGQSCTVRVKVCPVELEIAQGDDLVGKFAWATDGTTVKIAPGTYEIKTYIIVDKAIRVEGLGGTPADVVVQAKGGMRIFWISHPEAFVSGLTMLNGKVYQSTGGNCFICDWGGTVSNCVFAGGTADNYNGNGGNLYQYAGLVTHCVLTNSLVNNTGGGSKGGNVVITGGRLENSLIANGRDTTNGSSSSLTAGLRITGGKVMNCTIAGNASQSCGGVSSSGAGTIENCVIAGNGGSAPVRVDPPKNGDADYGVFVHCVIDTAEPVNETCIAASAGALMADVANGDFHAAPGAPSIDFPGASGAGAPETDLDGNPRIQGKGIDLGCYEYVAGGGLAVTFDSDIKQAICPVEVTFTATVDGADDGDVLSYGWDYDGDGNVDETTDTPVVKHTWTTGGTYTIGLYVSNATSGQSAQAIKADMEKFAPAVMYVDAASTGAVVPFASPETASSNLYEAIEAAVDGCEIVVAKGVYKGTGRPLVEKSLHIRGETGIPEDVLFDCNRRSMLFVNNAGALVESMMFTNGFSAASTDAGIEFGVNGGTVSNCVVHTTEAQNWNGSGSAVYCPYAGGFVTHCRFYDCKLQGACGGGSKPIVYLPKGRLENSFFTGCSDTFKAADDHIQMIYVGSKGSVVNCTFVGNTAGDCHFLEVGAGGVISNTVFAANTFPAKVDGDVRTGFCQEGIDLDAAFVNCATDFGEPLNATCKVGALETMFKNCAQGDYSPKADGPLYNAGVTPSGWEKITDLAGNPRVVGKAVDIGCYEGKAAGFTIYVR